MANIEGLLAGQNSHLLLEGHVLAKLRELPDNIVQCVTTSPPYYGLRSYETESQLWHGNRDCEHQWEVRPPRRLRTDKDVKNPTTIQNANKGSNHNLNPTKECSLCGGWFGELGHEPTPDMFIENLLDIFDEVKRVLRDDGVCYINIADSYVGGGNKRGGDAPLFNKQASNRGATGQCTEFQPNLEGTIYKPKDLYLVPQRLAIGLQERGWWIRNEIIWHKVNCMPESMHDRCTRSHEQIWMISKSPHYYYDQDAIREPHAEVSLERVQKPFRLTEQVEGRAVNTDGSESMERFCHPAGANRRTVWSLSTNQFKGKHYAGYPLDLPKICIMAATSEKGACVNCGSPYQRITEYESIERYELDPSDPRYRPSRYESKYEDIKGEDGTGMRYTVVKQLGWQPSCKCGSDKTRPCIVLDPFNGTGSTGIVALQNGRNYIGIELKPEYIKMTQERFVGGEDSLLGGI
jgi:DNA modification methylase